MSDASSLPSRLGLLIDALRQELGLYGEMLALLDSQQEHVMARSADEVMNSVASINTQMASIRDAREQRESRQRDLAAALGQPEDHAFAGLIPKLPESHRAAVDALVRENNALLFRVQQRARQNHLLLARSLEGMQQFIASLVPAARPATYNDTGRLQDPGLLPNRLYEAVG